MKRITSGQNPYVKHWRKLRLNKHYRFQQRRILIEGKKLVAEMAKRFSLKSLITTNPLALAAQETFLISEEIFSKISGVQNPEGVMAEVDLPPVKPFPAPLTRLLILDQINDPGNLGTLLRTAWALNWDAVFLLGEGCDPYNDKALRAAKGATFSLPWRQGTQEQLQQLVQKESLRVWGASMEGQPIAEWTDSGPCALALGNEAHGLNHTLRSCCQPLAIPMRPEVESLNVALAGAIFLYEMRKKQ